MLSVVTERRDMLTVGEVAHVLGLSRQRVNRLAETGALTRIARGLLDRTSVERYRVEHGTHGTRAWAERTAWGAVAMLAGAAPRGLGDTQTYRLRAALRETVDAGDLATRLRNRARVSTWSGHRSVVERIRADITTPGRARLGLVEDGSRVDGYVGADRLDDLLRHYRLSEDPDGAITLRSTSIDLDFVDYLARLNRTLAAVDAATSLDPRERGVGRQVLGRRIEMFRDNAHG